MMPRPPSSTLFPYTTLFRSLSGVALGEGLAVLAGRALSRFLYGVAGSDFLSLGAASLLLLVVRSEEHTSELQSRQYLVCRLLLEKKKNKAGTSHSPQSLPTT